MNSTLSNLLRGAAKTVRYLTLALLPALSSEMTAVSAQPHATTSGRLAGASRRSLPYLAMVGSPAIRVAEAMRALPEEPKLPTPTPTPTPIPEPPKPVHEEPRVEVIRVETPTPTPEPERTEPVTPGQRPVRILPDDTVRELHPEDVLPYFRYPGSNGSAPEAPAPQSPPPLPQSSATYNLK